MKESKQVAIATALLTALAAGGGGYIVLDSTGPYFVCKASDIKVIDVEHRRFVSCGEPTEEELNEALNDSL